MTGTITKKKKKIDFELLRKLEDEYDEAVEDTERKERHLIERVHSDYLKAEVKKDFFEELHHSYRWYYDKFEEYELNVVQLDKSQAQREAHQERKVQSIIEDLDEMEKDIENKPVVEIDEKLMEDEDYIDPREQEKDWIHRTKVEIQAVEPRTITTDSNFGKYQETKGMISKIMDIQKSDFKVSEKYRLILINKLDKSIEYLNKLRRDLDEKS